MITRYRYVEGGLDFDDNGDWCHLEEVQPYRDIVRRLAEINAVTTLEKLADVNQFIVDAKLLVKSE